MTSREAMIRYILVLFSATPSNIHATSYGVSSIMQSKYSSIISKIIKCGYVYEASVNPTSGIRAVNVI